MTTNNLKQGAAHSSTGAAQRPTIKRVSGDGGAWYVKRPWGWDHIGPRDLTAKQAHDAAVVHMEKPL